MSIAIRPAGPDDVAGVVEVFNGVIAERRYTAMAEPVTVATEAAYMAGLGPRGVMFVAVVDGRIVGFQTLEPFAAFTTSMDHVGILGTQLVPDWRGRGVGLALWEASTAFAREQGFEKILIYVRAGNAGALRFYRKLGFRDIGVARRQVCIDGVYEDEVFLEHMLRD